MNEPFGKNPEFYESRVVLLLKTLRDKYVIIKHKNRFKFLELIRWLIVQTLRFNLKESLLKSDEYNWRNKNLKYLV